MTAADLDIAQRITRLTPVGEVLGAIESRVMPVAPHEEAVVNAQGCVLAEDLVIRNAIPQRATALRDGWALRAEATSDASAYAPVLLPQAPTRVDAGDPLPDDTDSVAPLDTILVHAATAEAIAPITPGDGVLPPGGDARAGTLLRQAGERFRAVDVAALAALGEMRVDVRAPRVRIVCTSNTEPTQATATMIARAISAAGGRANVQNHVRLEAALNDRNSDAVVAIGGTGMGRNDHSVEILRRAGDVVAHGIAIMPGDTAAFGFAGSQPVLLLPGRPDSALAAWLMLGTPMMARLTCCSDAGVASTATLSRKITSTIGITDVVLVSLHAGRAEPLTTGYWPMQALTRANGWLAVPAEREGYPAGASIVVRTLP